MDLELTAERCSSSAPTRPSTTALSASAGLRACVIRTLNRATARSAKRLKSGSGIHPVQTMKTMKAQTMAETQVVVIDGQLAQQGARLEGGGRVVRVRPNEALVTERLGRQKLTLPEDELRVGTLRWPDGSLASINTQQFRAGLPGGQPGPVRTLP